MSSYFLGVSRKYNNSSKGIRTRTRPKGSFVANYVSESLHFEQKIISKSKFHLFKLRKKCKRRKVYCLECGNSYTAVIKGSKIITDCPVCES